MAKRVLNYPCWLHVRLAREQRSAFEAACEQRGIAVSKRSAVIRELITAWIGDVPVPTAAATEAPVTAAREIALSEPVEPEPEEPEHDEAEQTDKPPVRCPFCRKQVTVNEDEGTWHCATFRGCGKRGRLGDSVE